MKVDQALDHILSTASKKSLTLDILAVERNSTAISFQARKLESFAFSETRQVGVRVIDGYHQGIAYTESLSPESLNAMIDEAHANSRRIKKDYVTELSSATVLPNLEGLYDAKLEATPIEEKIKAAALLEGAALEFDNRITNVSHARYSDGRAQVWVANTQGLSGSYKVGSASAYSYCLAKDGEFTVMAGDNAMTRSFANLNTAEIARTGAKKTLARLGSVRPKTGRYTAVFENRAAETLVGRLANYFSGKAVFEKTSLLADKLNQVLFSKNFSLSDQPLFASAPGSRPFDEEGFASKRTELIVDGRLNQFLTNSIFAEKLKVPHTASASRSPSSELEVSASVLVVQPGSTDFKEMTNADHQVVVITGINGMAGFRFTSGDFSLPVEGMLFENGEFKGALKDFLISGNLIDLLSNIEAVGNDVRPPDSNIVCPSLLIRDLNISGEA